MTSFSAFLNRYESLLVYQAMLDDDLEEYSKTHPERIGHLTLKDLVHHSKQEWILTAVDATPDFFKNRRIVISKYARQLMEPTTTYPVIPAVVLEFPQMIIHRLMDDDQLNTFKHSPSNKLICVYSGWCSDTFMLDSIQYKKECLKHPNTGGMLHSITLHYSMRPYSKVKQ